MIAYLMDDAEREISCRRGMDVWDVYIEEICIRLGLTADGLSCRDMERPEELGRRRVIMIGAQMGKCLTGTARQVLDAWVLQGGILIGFAAPGMDRLFGVESFGVIPQNPDDYALAGYFTFQHHSLVHQVHSIHQHDQKLLIFSPCRLVRIIEGIELARLYGLGGAPTMCPAITWRVHGKGFAGYFAFDLPKTLWVLQQGRPLPVGRIGGTKDKSVTQGQTRVVAYADEILLALNNMIACSGMPSIDVLPPEGDTIPDTLLFWGGDCCAGESRDFVAVSNWMRGQGLPYHFNVFPRTFDTLNLAPADAELIRRNGHELSLHFHCHVERAPLNAATIKQQVDLFRRTYGNTPVCAVMHATVWAGHTEPVEWMVDAGVRADNSFASFVADDWVSNGPLFGFGFGTSFPFFFHGDARSGNRRLDMLELPIVCYELGHRGSVPPYKDKTASAADEVHLPLDLALKYRRIMNMFYHPVYIGQYPCCQAAILEALAYIRAKKAHVVHMGCDALNDWWRARAQSRILNVKCDGDGMVIDTECVHSKGMIINVPLMPEGTAEVRRGNGAAIWHERNEFGRRWLRIAVASGHDRVNITGAFLTCHSR